MNVKVMRCYATLKFFMTQHLGLRLHCILDACQQKTQVIIHFENNEGQLT